MLIRFGEFLLLLLLMPLLGAVALAVAVASAFAVAVFVVYLLWPYKRLYSVSYNKHEFLSQMKQSVQKTCSQEVSIHC